MSEGSQENSLSAKLQAEVDTFANPKPNCPARGTCNYFGTAISTSIYAAAYPEQFKAGHAQAKVNQCRIVAGVILAKSEECAGLKDQAGEGYTNCGVAGKVEEILTFLLSEPPKSVVSDDDGETEPPITGPYL